MAGLTRPAVTVALLAVCVVYIWSEIEASPVHKATGQAEFRTDLEKIIHATRQRTPFNGRQKRSVTGTRDSSDEDDVWTHRAEVDSAPSAGQWYTQRRAYRLRGAIGYDREYGLGGRDTYYYGDRFHGQRHGRGHGGRSHGPHHGRHSRRGGRHSGGRSRGWDYGGGRSRGWDISGGRSRGWDYGGRRSWGHGGRSREHNYGGGYGLHRHNSEDQSGTEYHVAYRYGTRYGRGESGSRYGSEGDSSGDRRYYRATVTL